ncbi:RHS repeat-associated core domain-containing protein [Dyella sp. S184]|uniref:RHS repeat-associated core domain-containing protein n=1 Tax=Dyella sp. S184 TaxID=1641862 RepID=UPI0020B1171B|nr:RHS repeat-associated core domain-containing protein [Dyella sp. S184]
MDLALTIRHLLSRHRVLPVLLLGGLMAGQVAYADSPVVTQNTYDTGDHVATVIDPRGLVTTYTHDGLGLLWQQVSPDTGTTSYAYDSYGRRSSMTRADGVQTTYGYDGLNRMTSVSAGGLTQSFTYDNCTNGLGRLCSDGDATGATSYSYTPEGWIAGRGFTIGSTTYALGYSHDSVGHVTTVNYPDGNQANYTYTDGVVSGLTLTMGGTTVNGATAISYQPMNLGMASWTSSNGLVNTMGYDTDGRLTGISVPSVQSLGFTYDNADRITQVANGIDGTQTQYFGYDAMSRLVSVYSGVDNESFQYDANGNRIAQTGDGASSLLNVSPTSNQIVSASGSLSAQYGYDAKGNTTTVNGAITYNYDAFNRMNAAGGMAYYVNPEGQRLRKTGTAGTTYFAPDQSGSLLAENPSGAWVDYVWLNGRLIGRMAANQADAIDDDQVGRPQVVTDSGHNIVWQAQNLAFTQNVTTASITLNLGFPGQYYDAETSAWNNGFRDYKSGLGRYIESDPIGQSGGINTYAYVGGNPLSRVDPYGMFWMPGDPLPQGLVDGVTGFGDGVFSAVTFGQLSLADLRNQSIYTAGAIDPCSKYYKNAFTYGQLYGAATVTAGVGGLAVKVAGAATTAQATYLSLQLATGAVDLTGYTVEGANYTQQLTAITSMAQDAANDAGLAKYLIMK